MTTSYNMKDNECYKLSIDYIFNLDTTTDTLDVKKLNKLFALYNFGTIGDTFIDYLKTTIYKNDVLSKDNIKSYNLNNMTYTDKDIDVFLSAFNKNNVLDVDLYYATVNKIFTNITKDAIINELKEIYGSDTTTYDISIFKNYLLKMLTS